MDDDSGTAHTAGQPRTPNPDLKRLDTLVGTWAMSGDVHGTVTYAWMDGGFFLIQHVNLEQQDGQPTKGMEIIGHLHRYGEEPSTDIHSRYYASMGETLDYVYELEGDTLTIWFGERGSPAYYQGTFSSDGPTLTGAWQYPGGGGYEAHATRIT